jgi:hypothetical protein
MPSSLKARTESLQRAGLALRLPLEHIEHTYGYDAQGRLSTDTVVHEGITFVQTMSYDASGRLTAQSKWVPQ